MPRTDDPVISGADVLVYEVPTDLPEADGTISWSSTTVVVTRVRAGELTGLGWTYASGACRALITEKLAPAIVGASPCDVPRCHEAMVRACRNLGRPGLVACAVSAVDTALWDLKARVIGVGLADLWGRCRDDVPLYGSGGFTTYDDRTTEAQLRGWVEGQGIPRVKIKIGESWGQRQDRDLTRATLARRVVGDSTELYVDANGGYTLKQAVRVGRRLEDLGVTWFEEPVSSDDLAGLRRARSQLGLDVAAGEYGYDEAYFHRMIAAGAVDCVQIDVTRCGGYTSWLRIAALAASAGLQVSGHCAPSLHAPVAAGVPNLRHLEYFHDHQRLEPTLFDGVLAPLEGALWPPRDVLGNGLVLKEPDAERFRVA